MNKVLYPFEIDREAYKEAYIYAVTIARNLRAELILLNAFYIEADNSITRSKYMQLLKNNWFRAYKEIHFYHDYYLRYCADMEPELRLKTDHRFIHGNLVDELRIIIKREKIDMVVLPATDENESSRKKLKSMRREILDQELTSLLIAPPDGYCKQIQNILYVYSPKELKTLLDRVNEVVLNLNISNAVFHFVPMSRHGMHEPDQDQEPLRSIIKEIKKNRVEFHGLQHKTQRKEIVDYISELDIQLLAFSKWQFLTLGNYFRRNIIDEINTVNKIPILILNDKDT